MTLRPRIGIQIGQADLYWVQVWETIWQQARLHDADVVEVALQEFRLLTADEELEAVESLLVQELDALICNSYPESLLERLLQRGIPVVFVAELQYRHELLVSRAGLADAAAQLAAYLEPRLSPQAPILLVGGGARGEDNGQSRVNGFLSTLAPARRGLVFQVPSDWTGDDGRRSLTDLLQARPDLQFDAVVGLSDKLALMAAEICRTHGSLRPGGVVLGINGDPEALAAISAGTMAATVETDVAEMARQAIQLALRAAARRPLPATFSVPQTLITAEQVQQAATRRLISLAGLPTRLIEAAQRSELLRTVQAETNAAIDRKISVLLDEAELIAAITRLIRENYRFDAAYFLIPAADLPGPAATALEQQQAVFVPDTQRSQRFAPDPDAPQTGSRLVLPVRVANEVLGLLDLHRRQPSHIGRDELDNLALLADRLAIAVRNARLYAREQHARLVAEQADQLKTTMLAHVSHELRTPLNIILGYGQSALNEVYSSAGRLVGDLQRIVQSGQHLQRLINDLLDLSRAEIGALELLIEPLQPQLLLHDVFATTRDRFAGASAVEWRLDLPAQLPVIHADGLRLRQILHNLLQNAHNFTQSGCITLAADVQPGCLQIRVADSGVGMSQEMASRAFLPFVTSRAPHGGSGVGLGLSIAQRLAELHQGRLLIEKSNAAGTTVLLELPIVRPAASDTAVSAVEAADAAVTDVILKPVDAQQVTQHVAQLLAAHAPHSATVLLVDDDPAQREYYRRVLASALPDLHLIEAADGVAALEQLRRLTPDLIVLDLVMPEIDGFAVLGAVRNEPRTAAVPVLVLSGKPLTAEDVRRLSDVRVTLQTKGLLSDDEFSGAVTRALAPGELLPTATSTLVKQAVALMHQRYTEPLARQTIAEAIGVHKDYLGRIFQQELGLTIGDYLTRYRISTACRLLRETDLLVAEIAVRVGFDTPTYFSQVFHRVTGSTPRAYRAGRTR